MKRVAENLGQLKTHFSYLSTTVRKWPVLIEVVDGYSERSLNQNSLLHRHMAEAAKFFGWTPQYAKRFVKYNYGLPILAGRTKRVKKKGVEYHVPTQDAIYYSDLLERLDLLPYEARILFMEKLPVTSEMTTMECKLLIDTYMIEWQQQGCLLTDPKKIDPEHYEQLEREARSRGEA